MKDALGFVGIFRPSGECSFVEAIELIRNAIERCRHREVSRLLVNLTGLTGISIPSLFDRFLALEELAHAAEGQVSVALVVPTEYIHPEKFGVAVAAHFGQKFDVFSSETDALVWISSLADLCLACRLLIDEPWTKSPHDALQTFGTSKVLVDDFKTQFYECRVCNALWKRTEAKSSSEVAWARIA